MVYAVRGRVLESMGGTVAVETAGGLVFEVVIPLQYHLEEGEEVLLYTHLSISERGVRLYGFKSRGERLLFEQLISISKVGPATAMSILSHFTPSQLREIVATEDVRALSGVRGVGKKTAERIILELKDKLMDVGEEEKDMEVAAQALSVLVSLGLDYATARKAIFAALKEGEYSSVEELVKKALIISRTR